MKILNEVDLATLQEEQDIDIKQLNFLQLHHQSVEFRYSLFDLIYKSNKQKKLLNSTNLRSDDF